VTLAVTFRAGLLGARPRQARLPQRHGCRRGIGGHWPGIAGYTHSTPPDRAGVTRSHIDKNPLRPGRSRPLIAVAGRLVAWFSIGTLSLHVGQYPPCERVSRKPWTPPRSLITVSDIVGPPHRLHSIAMSRLPILIQPADIKRSCEHIQNFQNLRSSIWVRSARRRRWRLHASSAMGRLAWPTSVSGLPRRNSSPLPSRPNATRTGDDRW
jgi:hypothetical protein